MLKMIGIVIAAARLSRLTLSKSRNMGREGREEREGRKGGKGK